MASDLVRVAQGQVPGILAVGFQSGYLSFFDEKKNKVVKMMTFEYPIKFLIFQRERLYVHLSDVLHVYEKLNLEGPEIELKEGPTEVIKIGRTSAICFVGPVLCSSTPTKVWGCLIEARLLGTHANPPPITTITSMRRVTCMAELQISDSRLALVTGSEGGDVAVWDVFSGNCLGRFVDPSASFTCISASGRLVCLGDARGEVYQLHYNAEQKSLKLLVIVEHYLQRRDPIVQCHLIQSDWSRAFIVTRKGAGVLDLKTRKLPTKIYHEDEVDITCSVVDAPRGRIFYGSSDSEFSVVGGKYPRIQKAFFGSLAPGKGVTAIAYRR